jgi:hypothetical protein
MPAAQISFEPTSQRPISFTGWGLMIVGGAVIWALIFALFF